MKIEEAYEAVKHGNLPALKEYFEQDVVVSPDAYLKILSLLYQAVAHAQFDIVQYLVCDVGLPTKVFQNWFVKINYYGMLPKFGKDDYKIKKFLQERSGSAL